MPNKPGRPPRAGTAATVQVTVPLTPAEKAELDRKARNATKSVADFIRDKVLPSDKEKDPDKG